ncbi:CoB--CoM heterodisulfide reductase iron-sulfur subunit A family protein [Ammonifex thiophilus]|uniref:CoB--CoM heterodisulfide reductase iron-sulfur subunit A family protein n=1 Tax=Ammonifex thiophilus TaxID=444093 RepID=A0A3D8P4G9_9THEO|nr:CoB--CoM heterodisulfide reductase iron-sulfur subunit A family protein [Ammonifex thiophilus]RDV84039.1 CoB--CoM heterodisulfide reductase iron-sulfur subunit A family protein [Ammonifex thiophilus]
MGSQNVLVVGGGISGITAAVEVAEASQGEVYLVEKRPYLGGRVTQLNQYFPKLCPPNCGLEINFKRIKNNPRIHVYTLAQVEEIKGEEGNFEVKVKINPRYVTAACTACGKCVEVCPAERPNEFNYNLDKTKAIYLPHIFAFPYKYVIDMQFCQGTSCSKCAEVCPVKAVDLNMQPETLTLQVGAIIWATGWDPYDITKLEKYGAGRYPNVITNVMMERLASKDGPTGGQILRPSDGKPAKKIAFVQCAGSRDENHLPYCSTVCCLASLKQALYVKERDPEAQVYFFFIDIRALGRYEDFFNRAKNEANITFIKGKVGEITEDPATKDLTLKVEDQSEGKLISETFDLVVLATGMMPTTKINPPPARVALDKDGFILNETPGIYGAGCVTRPVEVAAAVQEATAAALRALQSIRGR